MHHSSGAAAPTETTFLPVLTGTTPPDIRCEARVAKKTASVKRSPDHLRHHKVMAADAACQQRLVTAHSADTRPTSLMTIIMTLPVGETETPPMWHRACRRHFATLHKLRVGHVCLRTHHTVSAASGRLLHLVALLVFAVQMQQLGIGWKT